LFPSFPEESLKSYFSKEKTEKRKQKRVPAAGKRKRNKYLRLKRRGIERLHYAVVFCGCLGKFLSNAGKTLAALFLRFDWKTAP
jgi:hypothetical protein